MANAFYISGGSAGRRLRSQSPYLTPLSRIHSPAHTLAYQEVPSRNLWLWGSWASSPCSWTGREDSVEGNFNTVPGWHGMDFHFNVTFTDGHAATVKMQGCTRPSPNLGLMNYPMNQCGDSLSGYQCNQCITIRGPEWQLDTLPTPAALTPYYAGKSATSPDETTSSQRIFLP